MKTKTASGSQNEKKLEESRIQLKNFGFISTHDYLLENMKRINVTAKCDSETMIVRPLWIEKNTHNRKQGKNKYNGKLCIMEISHKDDIPTNNKYSNLEYICLICHNLQTDYRKNNGTTKQGRRNIVREDLKKLNSLKKTDYSGRGMKLEMQVK